MFIASDERVLCWGRTLLALERVHPEDEHFSAGDERVENARSSVSHTHTASYQRLRNRIYVGMIAIVTATYLRNGRYHVEEIQKVCRCTTAFWVSLN